MKLRKILGLSLSAHAMSNRNHNYSREFSRRRRQEQKREKRKLRRLAKRQKLADVHLVGNSQSLPNGTQ